MPGQITVDARFSGIAGRGQGGYLAGLVAGRTDQPIQVDFRNAIPLDTPLHVIDGGQPFRLIDGDKVIIERRDGSAPGRIPVFVDLEAAEKARDVAESEPLPYVGTCFSCGDRPGTLRVHAGPVGDGVFATPYTPPGWTGSNGIVEPPFVWAPLDCASGWAIAWDPPHPVTVTATLTVQIHETVEPGAEYVVVADTEPGWRARRRMAWSGMYSRAGDLMASAESMWVRLRTE